jgi:hypothetical protein
MGGLAIAAPARAALDPAVLEAIESPEVVAVAQAIAALLDGAGSDADAQQIAANLHSYLAESVYAGDVVETALAVVLDGQWSDDQLAALRSLYSEYAPETLEAPSGGGEVKPPMGAGDATEPAATADDGAGSDGSSGLATAAAVEPVEVEVAFESTPASQPESVVQPASVAQPESGAKTAGFTAPPPPPAGGGGSDYRQ